MANPFSPNNLTLSPVQVLDIQDVVLEKVFAKPSLQKMFTIATGIKAGKDIGFLGRLGLVGKTVSGCDPTPNPNGAVPTIKKQWNPKYIGDRFVWCFTDLLPTFFIWATKNGIDKKDLTNTDFANFFEERITDAIQEMILRKVFFDNPNMANEAQGGILKNGIDKTYFNSITGLWPQLFKVGVANSSQITSLAINNQTTYANQKWNANGTDTTNQIVTGVLDNMLYGADFRLRDSADKFFLCNQYTFDQYERERKAPTKTPSVPLAYSRVEDGINSLQSNGIDIIPLNIWDRTITSYFDNGTKYHQPHRILLSTKSNLVIGTEEVNNLADLDIFYDKKTQSMYVDFGFNLDIVEMEDYMVQMAYGTSQSGS